MWSMVIGRDARRAQRQPRVAELFGKDASVAQDVLELLELAWHDCYGEVTPPDRVMDDILLCSGGDLAQLVYTAKMAVHDWRDLRVWADDLRGGQAR